MRRGRGYQWPAALASLLALALLAPMPGSTSARADVEAGGAQSTPRITTGRISSLNDRFLLLNMHGLLFHEQPRDFQETATYARWIRAGVIRVFATDANTNKQWDGQKVGNVIADQAATFRAAEVKLLVALVNNHQPVPGEAPASYGPLDDYQQLLPPFYQANWRGAYLRFVTDLIATVKSRGALDVIYAWEIGNELHTPWDPPALIPFVTSVVAEIRRLDAQTPIFPGTMGVNHLEPWNPWSPVARWLYCQAPVDAYTLHAYDWVSRERQGDMPIDWDLDIVTAEPCSNGRRLPVVVEELGTSRSLRDLYSEEQATGRLRLEMQQLRLVLGYPQVVGVGVWSGYSPMVRDRSYFDGRRGLTSYGTEGAGGGSCYDPSPASVPGIRCDLEQVLRNLPALPPS